MKCFLYPSHFAFFFIEENAFNCAPHVFWSLRTPARDSGPDQRGADYAGLFETCRSSNTPQIAIGTGSGTGSAQLQLQFRSGTRDFRELQLQLCRSCPKPGQSVTCLSVCLCKQFRGGGERFLLKNPRLRTVGHKEGSQKRVPDLIEQKIL